MSTKFKTSPRTFSLGQLGVITALDLTPHGYDQPVSTYIGGLEYALAPTGEYRFRPPRHLPRDFSYGSATKPGSYVGQTNYCPQPSSALYPDRDGGDEDCLQVNVWIPHGPQPDGGWPVLFWIHGGWLQCGNANMPPTVVANLMHETPFKAIVVMPSYRLNLFGFLASPELEAQARKRGETVGNMGFWDQRMALEWTKRNARSFGGNNSKITVAGNSAGSHSSFQQLAYDLDRPKAEQCIGRVIMFSNGPGVKAKGINEHGKQFNEPLTRLNINLDLTAEEKLKRLQALPTETLVAVQNKMTLSEFRALSDGTFINQQLHQSINNGTLAKKCKARGINILNGECSEEWNMYAAWRTPSDSYDSIYTRLVADYSERVVAKLAPLYFPGKKLPAKYKDWVDAFGKVYADMQVYATERGFANALHENGFTTGKDLLRYRIEWRAKCVQLAPEWGVTHSSDMAIWWWGSGHGKGLPEEEKKMVAPPDIRRLCQLLGCRVAREGPEKAASSWFQWAHSDG